MESILKTLSERRKIKMEQKIEVKPEKKEKPKPLLEQISSIRKDLDDPVKKKKLRIPRKAKVRRGKIKKGWIGVIKVEENGNITGEKQRIEDSTIRLKDKTYHSTDGSEIGFWEGKHPVMIQQVWRKNPMKIRKGDDKNETYGQKYIMARMLGDTIKVKAAAGAKGLLYVVLAGAVIYGGYMLLTGQL